LGKIPALPGKNTQYNNNKGLPFYIFIS